MNLSTRRSGRAARLPGYVAIACGTWIAAAAAQGTEEGAHPLPPTRLDDVIVSARHRDEIAADVPLSVSSVPGEVLASLHADGVPDLHAWLPGLNVAYADPRAISFSVRGIGNSPVNEGIESSVGLYLDDVYLGRQGMTAFELMDIDRIELLRGPQGTLFGKNTTSGVLHIRTRAPGFTPRVQAEAAGSSRSGHRLRASAAGPLGRSVAAGVSGYRTSDDGWLRNLHDGGRLNGIERDGLRAQLLVDPRSDWTLRLSADWHEQADSQGAMVLTGVGPERDGFRNLEESVAHVGAGPLPLDPMRYEVNLDDGQRSRSELGGLSARAGLRFGELRITSISAWRFWDYASRVDVDRSAADILRFDLSARQRQWSQELRISSPSSNAMDWTVGAFYLGQATRNALPQIFGDDADIALLPAPIRDEDQDTINGIRSDNFGWIDSQSAAVFGEANWHLTERMDVSAGLRGTWEKRSGRTQRTPYSGAAPSTDPGVIALRESLYGAYDSDEDGGLREHDFAPSAQLSLSYRPADVMLTWVRLASSEKSGGFNVTTPGSAPRLGTGLLRFGPERAASAEIGLRHLAADGRLETAATVFFSRIRDYQAQQVYYPPDQTGATVVLTNVGEVESRGVEWELRWLALRGLQLGLNGSFADASYRDFADAPCPAEANPDAPPACDLTGEQLQGSPRWTVNALARYHWNWSARTAQNVNLSWGYRSARAGNLDNSTYNRLQAYRLLDVATRVTYETGKGRLAVSAWARNLLDERYLLGGAPTAIGAAYAASAGQPRTLGLGLGYDW